MIAQPTPMEPPRILVTGSSGFVGRHFCSRYGGISLTDENGQVDLCDAARVRQAVTRAAPEAVLHLAAQSSVVSSFADPASTFAVNFLGTLNLLEALSAIEFQGAFVYVGSADIYGKTSDADLPTRETHPLHPLSPYAVSKVAAEALCYQWGQTNDLHVVLTRPFNQIGPGQDRRFAVVGFARQIVGIRKGRQSPTLVTGNLDVTRDFTDVRDAVRAYSMLLSSGQDGEVYNICSGRERSLRSIAEALMRIAGVEAQLEVDPARLRPSEQHRVVGDPSKIRSQIGWIAEIPLEDTLADILRDIEENG
ncbi:MAG: GDP-mannose 4,6-dehydratase [Terracidiphilus sp.]